jgi:hypothetical protein
MNDKRLTGRTGKWIGASTAAILILILLTPLTIGASGSHFVTLQERLIADGL